MSYKAHMNGGGESYNIVLAKQLNKSGRPLAEVVKGRPPTKEGAADKAEELAR